MTRQGRGASISLTWSMQFYSNSKTGQNNVSNKIHGGREPFYTNQAEALFFQQLLEVVGTKMLSKNNL